MRKTCRICGKKIIGYKLRYYCSTKCRNRRNYLSGGYKTSQEWSRRKRAEYSPDKIQCLICGGWYVQVGSHVWYAHKMTARQYREEFKLEVKRGVTTPEYRKLKGDIAIKNKTYKNLKSGEIHRFKKGQIGIGVYERSPITLERLKVLHKLKKKGNV